jgi:hypothetical protein
MIRLCATSPSGSVMAARVNIRDWRYGDSTVGLHRADLQAEREAAAGTQVPATGPGERVTGGNANGDTPFQLSHIGWSCLNVPGHGVHCLDPHFDHERASNTHYQVKVFDTADPSSDAATFLGTESLLRSDHYHGQPCLPGHGEYFAIPLGPSVYYGCHHFDF